MATTKFSPTYGSKSRKAGKAQRSTSPSDTQPSGPRGERPDVYAIVTESIIKCLEAGTVPWRRPWTVNQPLGPNGKPLPLSPIFRAQKNLLSGKAYRGINVMALMASGFDRGYISPYWMTYNQAVEIGGQVRKGEKGTAIIFWKLLEKKGADGEAADREDDDRSFPMARYYYVFNAEQIDGIEDHPVIKAEREAQEAARKKAEEQAKKDKAALKKAGAKAKAKKPAAPVVDVATAESMVTGMPFKPEIRHGGHRAYYSPLADFVQMPKADTFESPAHYYGTLFHELAHSTGHASRLNREELAQINMFGDHAYSQEELTAEIGAAFLCAEAEISPIVIENQASYISHWLGKLKNDRKFFVQAAGRAQKAADFVMGRQEKKAQPAGKAA